MTSKVAAVALVVVALAAEALAQGAKFRIYEPRSRTAEELAPLVAPMLGPDGAAVPDPNGGSLILQGDSAAIADALAALETLDAPLRQYRIESETRGREALDDVFANAGWVDRGGFRIARIAAGAHTGTRAHSVAASVVVLEGRTAEVWTGSLVPMHFGSELALVPAQSGFRVRPRSLGSGEIELEITPVLAERGRGGEIRETGAATQLRVSPGEAVAIAGIDETRDGRGASFPPGVHAESGTGDSAVIVRVTPFESVPAARKR